MPNTRPLRSCSPSSRTGTVCFWTVLLLFFAGIGYLGLLAYSRNAGQSQPDTGTGGHLLLGFVIVGCAIGVVISVIATRYKRLN